MIIDNKENHHVVGVGFTAVSYKHLSVSFLFPFSNQIFTLFLVQFVDSLLVLFQMRAQHGIHTVSYTHLDVYKRQFLCGVGHGTVGIGVEVAHHAVHLQHLVDVPGADAVVVPLLREVRIKMCIRDSLTDEPCKEQNKCQPP